MGMAAFRKADYVIILKINPVIRLKRLFNREMNERKRNHRLFKKFLLCYHDLAYNIGKYYSHKKLTKKFNKYHLVLKNENEIKKFMERLKN